MSAFGPTELLLISIICIPMVLLASGTMVLFYLLVRRSRSSPASPPPLAAPVNDSGARLQKLQALLQANLISQEEFDKKKAEILAEL